MSEEAASTGSSRNAPERIRVNGRRKENSLIV
jgi:hypothetical protein